MEMYGSAIVGGLLSSIPVLVGWIIAVVLAAIMLRRGGARAERFLVAGTLLMLAQSLITALIAAITMWLTFGRDITNVEMASVMGAFGLIRGLIGLAGIICLVYAFWVKFNQAKSWVGDRNERT